MAPFELAEPRTLDEALGLLDGDDTSVRAAGGATALMLMMKAGVLKPRRLVSLRRIESRYFGIEAGEAAVRIGAQATLAELERSAIVARALPPLRRALVRLANVRVRNVATLGGHLAHADPHMDLPPILCALGVEVGIKGPRGERRLGVEELVRGYMETALAPGELIVEVHVPIARARYCAYSKVTTRSADDWPALGVAVALDVTPDGGVRDARVVVGAAVDRPTRLRSVERLLAGSLLVDGRGSEAARVIEAGEAAAAEIDPIADQHGSAAYKRELTRVYVRRTLQAALTAGANPR